MEHGNRAAFVNTAFNLLAFPLLASAAAEPSSAVKGRLVLDTAVVIGGFYDDNVFGTPPPGEASAAFRARPTLGLTYRAARKLSFTGSYATVSEAYAAFPEENRFFASQRAGLGARYQMTRKTSVSIDGGYAMSRTPRDLAEGGLEFGRQDAESFNGGAGIQQRLGRKDTLGLSYTYAGLVFGARETTRSETWSADWSHNFGRNLDVSFGGGLQNVAGIRSAHWSTRISRGFRGGAVALAYSRRDHAVPTELGKIESEVASVSFSRTLGRDVMVEVSPSLSRSADVALFTVARVSTTITYAITRSIGVQAAYLGSDQRLADGGSTGTLRDRDGIRRNVYRIGLAFAHSRRVF